METSENMFQSICEIHAAFVFEETAKEQFIRIMRIVSSDVSSDVSGDVSSDVSGDD